MGKEQGQIPLDDINLGNEGLPDGAKKFQDTSTATLLEKMWQQEIDFYNQTQIYIDAGLSAGGKNISVLKKFKVEISGPDSHIFKGESYPQVEGNSWYRGIAVRVDANNPYKQVIIFSGWMQPWIEGEAPAPIVYTVGEIPAKTVHNVIREYTSGILSLMASQEAILLRGRDGSNRRSRS